MTSRSARSAVATPRGSTVAVAGPRGSAAVLALAALARRPLDGYVRLADRYGDTVRYRYAPGAYFYMLSRPEHAEHVLAANQDNYVKAFTYRPLRALIGNGLLTSEGEDWRRHRRLVQPVFSRREVLVFGPAMAEAAQRMLARWGALADGAVLDVSGQLSALALDIVGRALFGADLTGDARQLSRVMNIGQRVAVLATFAPVPWGRVSTRAVKAAIRMLGRGADGVAGVPVPAGSLIAIPPYLVHRHPEFWPDPAGFDPARFLPGTAQDRHRYAYIPFGGGRRACIGQSFAELETVLVLAAIAQRYRLELTVRGLPEPVANVTLRPGGSLPMRLLRRPE